MIIDDLAGGKFNSTGIQKYDNGHGKYSVFVQFDNDTPKELFKNLAVGEKFNLVLDGPGPNSQFIFTDNETGKIFKIFAK